MDKKEQSLKPTVLWLTGLSGSGKSTISERVYATLLQQNYEVEHLDGDAVRDVFPKTGFSREERTAHLKKIGFLASKLQKHDVFVVCSFISPYEDVRNYIREMCDDFTLVYVSTPLEECERRDVKGLYEKARNGEIEQFTGISDPYEEPENPELTIDTTHIAVEDAVKKVFDFLSSNAVKQKTFID